MRTLFIFSILALSMCITTNAQICLIDDFSLSGTDGAYGIYADIDCNGKDIFYIDMDAPNKNQRVQMEIWGKHIDGFINSLQQAKLKYELYSKTAKKNNITLLSKDIKVSFSDREIYFTVDDKWHKENGVDLKCKFLATADGNCLLLLQTDYMTSTEVVSHSYSVGRAYNLMSGRWSLSFSSNEISITRYCSGASLMFSSTEEIDYFANKLKKAKDWKNKNIQQCKLFQ